VSVQRVAAEQALKAFQEHPEAWTRVDSILEKAKTQQTKYFALQVGQLPAWIQQGAEGVPLVSRISLLSLVPEALASTGSGVMTTRRRAMLGRALQQPSLRGCRGVSLVLHQHAHTCGPTGASQAAGCAAVTAQHIRFVAER
jgi:hypothetical protein